MADDDEFVRITLRIPAGLHGKLNDAAAKKRSMNAEIIERLEHSFENSPKGLLDDESVAKIINYAAEASAHRTLAEFTAAIILAEVDDQPVSSSAVLAKVFDATRERLERRDIGVFDEKNPIKEARLKVEKILRDRVSKSTSASEPDIVLMAVDQKTGIQKPIAIIQAKGMNMTEVVDHVGERIRGSDILMTNAKNQNK